MVSAVVLLSQFFLQHLDLIDRYRMIWILNGRTPWTTITTIGSIIYFCTVTCKSF